MKNSYYKKFCHDFSNFSDFLNNFLQKNLYSSEIDYNFMNNKNFFNNNIKCYNCDAEFSSNNQLHNYLTECKSSMLQISDKYLIIFTQEFRIQANQSADFAFHY